jgi:hypothetical protein
MLKVPAGVDGEVVMVRVEEPALVMEVGLKLPVVPAGNLPRLNATLPLKPPAAAVDRV